MLSLIKIKSLNFPLRRFNRGRNHFIFNRLLLRVPLPAGPSAKLVVNSPRFVPLRANHQKPTDFADSPCFLETWRVSSENYVHSPAGHVGGNRHRAESSGLGDDGTLLFMIFGV